MSSQDERAAVRYKSSVQLGRWFFGFTLGRFSLFVAWKSDATWRNYGWLLERDV